MGGTKGVYMRTISNHPPSIHNTGFLGAVLANPINITLMFMKPLHSFIFQKKRSFDVALHLRN